MNEIKIKSNKLFFNNKKLPSNINEFVGEILENKTEFLILKLFEINSFPSENNFKKIKGKPKFDKLKIFKPVPGLFMEYKEGDIVKITTVIAKKNEIISDIEIITKELLLNIKRI